jgi:predicted TIM-barrel enzyme/DNA-binding NtrC family response regulator
MLVRNQMAGARLRQVSAGRGGFLVGAAIGTGLAAQAATRGGADFLLALNAGRIRSMGEPSIASMLALRDTNRFVLDYAAAEIRPHTDLPVFLGAAAFDPTLDVTAYLDAVRSAGFDGITNFPTTVLLDGRYRRFLEASGYGFARELALLKAAQEHGLATLAYVHTVEEARRAASFGVDIVNIDLGWNTGGTLGVATPMSLHEAGELAARMTQTVRRRCPGTLCTLEGGPIVSPEQADEVCRAAGVDGYIGGSTIDRVPLETAVELVTSAFKAVGALRQKVSTLEQQLAPQRWPPSLIGTAPSVQRARSAFVQAAATDLPVLLLGEAGTGKQDLARALHAASGRRNRRLMWVTLGSRPTPAEVDLFGCEANALPDVPRRRFGALELAHGSTLVLDGVDHLERGTQLRLCAALASLSFRRIGGAELMSLDTRLIAIAGSDRVALNGLEPQLLDLLGAIRIEPPPLREHADDLPQIIQRMLDAATDPPRQKPLRLDPAALRMLLIHHWPNNLRELSSVLEHARLVATDGVIRPKDLPALTTRPPDLVASVSNEREWILDGLRRHRFRRGDTARFLGVSRKTLYNKMVTLGLLLPDAEPERVDAGE